MLQLDQLFAQSKSTQAFYKAIQEQGLDLYFRCKQPGIKGVKRKYRLSNLGYSLERIQTLDLSKTKRQQELQRIIQLKIEQQQNNENEHEL